MAKARKPVWQPPPVVRVPRPKLSALFLWARADEVQSTWTELKAKPTKPQSVGAK